MKFVYKRKDGKYSLTCPKLLTITQAVKLYDSLKKSLGLCEPMKNIDKKMSPKWIKVPVRRNQR